eukprot:CAMPEP_0185580548 /NCGR_PEP_ID=MMETSP0434-20130131/16978_1 /TAXON_ID=626734 ORGANISM="Favella taraikaensis, Strain Fe Narragansett Bay" /NCGR_SAMPLE_ID=MMETSP0434 /ASSEMBLY_ACC=CAM_ASM_000379 /LENGTH=66 /DNA_ID=CAMNT_0028198847 /DNA_START=585 /DNA_END=785 /DNA_ORIENTATION=+
MSGVEVPSDLVGSHAEPTEDDPYNFIDVVFGVQSKQSYEAFIEQVIQKATWIFSAPTLRQKLWQHA